MNNNNKKETVFHETAGGVVLYCNKDSLIAALLQKNTGDWVLPKGHIKPNEKNVATALREIREELGLKNKTELQMIGKLKTVKYKFKLRDDNREHIKKVSLFTFTTIKKYKLIPLLEENNIKARWFSIQVAEEKLTHESDREALREAAAKYFLWQKKKKTDKFNQSCPDLSKMVISFCNKLRRNLFALILTGSLPAGYFKNDWSDIDILIVVKNLNLKTKQLIAINKQHLENHYRRHFGINVVAVENITKPVFPAISLDGKVLQTLREIKKHPERIVFSKNKKINFYSPTSKEIKDYSLSNISMLLLRNRKTIIDKIPSNFGDYKKIVAKEMRAAFIITKLAIQHFTEYACKNNEEVIIKAENIFVNFDFSVLRNNRLTIGKWTLIKNKAHLTKILIQTDKFIENFSSYVFQKAKKY